MAYLTGLGLENFRVFGKETWFDFAPITVFTGPNSSGKSSIFKALLLLADNAKKNGLNELDFTGELHNLGTFEMARNYSNTKSNEITITRKYFPLSEIFYREIFIRTVYKDSKLVELMFLTDINFDNSTENIVAAFKQLSTENENNERKEYISSYVNIKWFFQYFVDVVIPKTELFERQRLEAKANKERPVFFLIDDKHKILAQFIGISNDIFNKDLLREKLNSFSSYKVNKFIELVNDLLFHNIEYQIDRFDRFGGYDVEITNVLDYWIKAQKHNEEQSLRELFNERVDEWKEYLDIFGHIKIRELFNDKYILFIKDVFIPTWKEIINNVHKNIKIDYLEAVRANTQRLYTNRSQGTLFNQLLLESRKENANWLIERAMRGIPDNELDFESNFINYWLKIFGIGDKLEINQIQGVVTEVSVFRGERKINLADFGYGVTQLLPLILIIVYKFSFKFDKTNFARYEHLHTVNSITYPNGPVLLIEEPETNLHPNLQSKIADFLVDVAQKFHITLIVETHSEYLIRRLQVLTAEKEIKPEDSVIYYLHDPNNIPEGQEQVKKINIEEDGGLTDDFGPGFFDEATNAKIQLVKLKNTARNNKNSN